MKTGISVTCATCGRTKAPHGRDVPAAEGASYCRSGACPDYIHEPLPGCLWPGETAEEYGYYSCDAATEDR